jgi:hypothetical protein
MFAGKARSHRFNNAFRLLWLVQSHKFYKFLE